ncbi:MAG: hypothetical protein HN742_23085 [Lentisphaerae bacterium]|jgi:dienelactone hydrolase|nr:hypothetical protein [Lentisphaerota bacterium]MBT4819490.1 hypothetical protein [Lentisphaerota bacterium]MBT5605362.1 hypothetical protein [Lentisphaerota bacterium]MBT7060367.1 hypothetical protein [Lentisphaerota bacterium]MBT7844779.1 hypothetical protein [Lentisphaerota bacterium]
MTDAAFRERLLKSLGGPWPTPCELELETAAAPIQKDGYRLETVTYNVEPDERVASYVLVPDEVTVDQPAPGIAVWHQHAGQWHLGKSEPAGIEGDPMHHTGVALAQEGYVVICPDALCFEDRRRATEKLDGRGYERFEFLRYVVNGKCLAWKHILDMRRAIDCLVSRPDVRGNQVGCYGHSMGSTHTWLVGPWDERICCLVANCCLPTYEAIHREHMLHCFANFIPGLADFGDTPDVAALIAPRALHMNFGENDGGSPIDDVRRGVEAIAGQYAAMGVPGQFSSYIEEGSGHVLSPEMWRRTKEWFAQHLGS